MILFLWHLTLMLFELASTAWQGTRTKDTLVEVIELLLPLVFDVDADADGGFYA